MIGVVAAALWAVLSWMPSPNEHALVTSTPMSRPKMQDVRDFLAKAVVAESIEDPVQRCVAYPDPPESHWSHPVVSLYCRYVLESVVSADEIRNLIRKGRADEVDRLLADALKQELSHTGTPGLLDRIYYKDFRTASTPELREAVDAWKRKSPRSAFALAASGSLRMAAAYQSGVNSDPDAVGLLLKAARADLDKAVQLDPRIIPAYAAMISLSGLQQDHDYAVTAGKRALEIDSSNFSIHAQLSWLAHPNWQGSAAAMREVAMQAQQHADANPLLTLLATDADAAQAGIAVDGTSTPQQGSYQLSIFRKVFDRTPTVGALIAAAHGAQTSQPKSYNQPDLDLWRVQCIYTSEALRFAPDNVELRKDRIGLVSKSERFIGEEDRLRRIDADRAIAAAPHDRDVLVLRGAMEGNEHDYAAAENDFLAALAITHDPSESLQLADASGQIEGALGQVYIDSHQWDKGWIFADSLIHKNPESAEGWYLRAKIQKFQPRAGLRDTYDYFVTHFGRHPESPYIGQYDEEQQIAEMKQWLGIGTRAR